MLWHRRKREGRVSLLLILFGFQCLLLVHVNTISSEFSAIMGNGTKKSSRRAKDSAVAKIRELRVVELKELVHFCTGNCFPKLSKQALVDKCLDCLKYAENVSSVIELISQLHKQRWGFATPKHRPSTSVDPGNHHLAPSLAGNQLQESHSSTTAGRMFPFFDLWNVLVHQVPTPDCSGRRYYMGLNTIANICFQISPQQLARRRHGDCLQVLLVFKTHQSVADTNETTSLSSFVRCPAGFAVAVNGKACNTTVDCDKQTQAGLLPLDITELCYLTPKKNNCVTITQIQARVGAFTASVHLGRKRLPCEVTEYIRSKSHSVSDGKQLIKKMCKSAKSLSDVTLSSGSMVLTCPLSATRLVHPGRSKSCSHIQCFDIITYLKLNEGRAKWLCPICKKRATVEDLFIDNFVVEILHSTPKEVDRVDFYPDGSWKAVEASRGIRSGQKRAQSAGASSDPHFESSAKRRDNGRGMECVIDLTVDDAPSASRKRPKGQKKQQKSRNREWLHAASKCRLRGTMVNPIVLD